MTIPGTGGGAPGPTAEPPTNSAPLVSVVIPCYNRADFIVDAVRSALDQRGLKVEVIVVDDASIDGTHDVLAEFGEQITVIRQPVQGERGAARNCGARAAHGEFIAFLDADDRWLPGKLAAQVQLGQHYEASVTDFEYVDESGHVIRTDHPPADATLADVVAGPVAFGAGSNLMVSRRAFDETGGFPEERELAGSEDWLFMASLLASGISIGVVRQSLVRVTVHGGQSTATASGRSSLWPAVAWLEARGYVGGRRARRTRARVAGVLAAGHAFEGNTRAAASWLRRAMHQGVTPELGVAACHVASTRVTGAMRRHRLGSVIDSARRARDAVAARRRTTRARVK